MSWKRKGESSLVSTFWLFIDYFSLSSEPHLIYTKMPYTM